MDKKISVLINNYSDNEVLLNKLVVSSFCRYHNLSIGKGMLAQYAANIHCPIYPLLKSVPYVGGKMTVLWKMNQINGRELPMIYA